MNPRERLDRLATMAAAAIVEDRYAAVHAPRGWLHAARTDSAFFLDSDFAYELDPRASRSTPLVDEPHGASPRAQLRADDELSRAAATHLSRLGELRDPVRLHTALDDLASLDDAACTVDDVVSSRAHAAIGARDPLETPVCAEAASLDHGPRAHDDPASHAHAASDDRARLGPPARDLGTVWPAAAPLVANDDRLNVVVLGAGPIGLAVASALLLSLQQRVSVVVVDTRVAEPGRKRPYARRWLTAVDHQRLDGIVETDVREIFARVGTRHIGVTIRVLETLLFLSCRRMGAKFSFDPDPDLGVLAAWAHLVVDATGNRMHPLDDTPITSTERLDDDIEIASAGDLRFPLHRGQRVAQAMRKIIGIPARIWDALVDHVAARNHDSKFFLWRGSLREEINEGLVLVNLTRAEYESGAIDPRTDELLGFITARATDEERAWIELDAPFVWRPYWVDERTPATLHGRPLVRVGDSIYNGNVEIANGLGPHLSHVAHVQRVVWNHMTSLHAETIAASMGRRR